MNKIEKLENDRKRKFLKIEKNNEFISENVGQFENLLFLQSASLCSFVCIAAKTKIAEAACDFITIDKF